MTDLGIYHYGARFYSPTIGRFLSADTLVPNPLNPQDFNRFSYVRNNPIKYTDPTGHMLDTGQNEGGGGCNNISCFPQSPNNPSDGDGGGKNDGNGGNPYDTDGDSIPNIPDPNYDPVTIGTTSGCNQSNLVECFYTRERPYFYSGYLMISREELNKLFLAVFLDVKQRNRSPMDRLFYDTPLWDGYGDTPGFVCISDSCFDRPEVNYYAQGMYAATEGESLEQGEGIVYIYKLYKRITEPDNYPSAEPSSGTLYWFEQGYNDYDVLNQYYRP